MSDLIERQAAIDVVMECYFNDDLFEEYEYRLQEIPPATLPRDIPMKPIEATDRAWGITHKQGVCPNCDCYLSHYNFIPVSGGKRRKITYCDACGQAIDWEGWEDEQVN